MGDFYVIDRRKNPKGKNLPNRQRFISKNKKRIQDQVRKAAGSRNISSSPEGEEIVLDSHSISEPNFGYDYNTGEWDRVLPGNDQFNVGDTIPKNSGGASGSDTGDDPFKFSLSSEEYLDVLFDNLELPDLVKKAKENMETTHRKVAGFQSSGSPSKLALIRSMKNALGRRLSLNRPKSEEIEELQKLLNAEPDLTKKQEYLEKIQLLKSKQRRIPWLDPLDMRYRSVVEYSIPTTQAVMFCLMDVSGSMDQERKDIAKRFYLLLYLFLRRKYDKIDIVFIRHHDEAFESTEEEFFYKQESGGTTISSGLKLIDEIIKDRYANSGDWNIYVAQASDGENYEADTPKVDFYLNRLLPLIQYYVYIQIGEEYDPNNIWYVPPTLWNQMLDLRKIYNNLYLSRLITERDVVPEFRKIFTKK